MQPLREHTLPSLATLAARAVAITQLDRLPGARLSALPPAVKSKLIAAAVATRSLTDECLTHLGSGHTELSVRASRVTDRGLGRTMVDSASGCLLKLDLSRCAQLRDAGIVKLASCCPQLRALDLSHCRLTDAAFEAVARGCPNLHALDASWNGSGVGERTVRALASHSAQLESLAICGCRVHDDALLALACACARLMALHTRGCEALTEAGLVAVLCTLPRVQSLELCQVPRLSEPSVHLLLGARPSLPSAAPSALGLGACSAPPPLPPALRPCFARAPPVLRPCSSRASPVLRPCFARSSPVPRHWSGGAMHASRTAL